MKKMIQRKTKTSISKSTYAQKNVEGNISMRKVIEDLKKNQMVFLEVKNTMCEVKNTMCEVKNIMSEVKNTCWRLITEKKKPAEKEIRTPFLKTQQ